MKNRRCPVFLCFLFPSLISSSPATIVHQYFNAHQEFAEEVAYQSTEDSSLEMEVKYDKFKKQTGYGMKEPAIDLLGETISDPSSRTGFLKWMSGKFSMNILYACPGQSRCRPSVVLLQFSIISKQWHLLKGDHGLILLVDGQRLNLGQAKWDGNVGSYGDTFEFLSKIIPTEKLERILVGSSLEGQLGDLDFKIAEEDYQALKRLYKFSPRPLSPRH